MIHLYIVGFLRFLKNPYDTFYRPLYQQLKEAE